MVNKTLGVGLAAAWVLVVSGIIFGLSARDVGWRYALGLAAVVALAMAGVFAIDCLIAWGRP